ncbi:MAG: OsmC family protein [Gemmatimonadetes bacterium]|nr:OsmC family protein [Gemmatimonadota bacterium]
MDREELRPQAPIVVTPAGGVRFSAQVRGHRIETDQPRAAGGEDAAATPLELLGVALANCIALYVGQFCNVRGVPLEGLRVEVVPSVAREPYRIGHYAVRVQLPAGIPERYRAAIERVVRGCPAHATLVRGPRIDVAIEAAEPSEAIAAGRGERGLSTGRLWI